MESRYLMTFTPDRSSIVNITQANPAVVTTDVAHGFFTGNVVALNVPKNYGMFELNNLKVQVIVLSDVTFACYYSLCPFVVPVDSTNLPAFVIPANPGYIASVIPVGSGPTPVDVLSWQIASGFCETPLTDTVLNNSTVEIPF
jgi:hypothetical protein